MIKRLLLKLSILFFCFSFHFINVTNAVFTDSAQINNNQFTTGDWTAPYVKIDNPLDSQTVSAMVDIRGTVTDLNPHHYWLVIQNSSGTTVAGPGVVNDTNSFTNQHLYAWDTTGFPDGDYIVKLEARDVAGNKDPNLAPVPSDPENPSDSVDWITITVNNPPSIPGVNEGDVVINEVYYDVKNDGTKGSEDKNEWIELYNNTDSPINLKGWYLTDLTHTKTINPNVSIPAHSYLLLAHDHNTWVHYWDSHGVPTVNLIGAKAWLNNNGDQLFLKDSSGQEIDFVAWEGGENNAYPTWNLNATQGKSIARKTAGVDTDKPSDWQVLNSPNPGTNPHSYLNTQIDFQISEDERSVKFTASGISPYSKLEYEITYEPSNRAPQGIGSSIAIEGQNEITKDGLMLGTDSSGDWVWDVGMEKIYLKIILTGEGMPERTLEKEIVYQ